MASFFDVGKGFSKDFSLFLLFLYYMEPFFEGLAKHEHIVTSFPITEKKSKKIDNFLVVHSTLEHIVTLAKESITELISHGLGDNEFS
jgi:hypothetical protein